MRADARRNREQILAAAEEAFADEGLGVPVDRIAVRAGVGAGTIYRHFPTKEALFEAVIVEHMERLADDARAMATSGGPPGAALFEFMARLAREAAARRNLIEALMGAGVDIKESAAQAKAEIEAGFARLLSLAQDAGQVRRDVTVSDLFALVMGTCAFADEAGTCSQNRMIEVVCDGLRLDPAGR